MTFPYIPVILFILAALINIPSMLEGQQMPTFIVGLSIGCLITVIITYIGLRG